ncbi:NUDIX hydrolase [Aureitalea marina]|uniref:NrtR DNA-binding winged helix domain-containing protein n=1 Tax=Aureitalea marina TaxID=930804 RepID=A0A2S7KSV3_9FLAO|nr:NUDIX domain-containing protein [Aureitalea marina]PQB05696.1 hypothetical protein BST85_12900 [Aureitalea marina]
MDFHHFFTHGQEEYLQNLSIDLVVFGYEDDQLKCLLLKFGDKWVLPGGYIPRDSSVTDAASLILRARTGLSDPHLEFLSVFGNPDRKFAEQFELFAQKLGIPWQSDYWVNDRFVTLAYYSLVDINTAFPVAGEMDEEVRWFSFDQLPSMWIDHQEIASQARHRIKEVLKYKPLSYKLLPPTFTMPQLHKLQEMIQEEKIDRSRFQKKMLATDLFERLPVVKKESPGRSPYQYQLK